MNDKGVQACWDNFYGTEHSEIEGPPAFAQYCVSRLVSGTTVFELGCGNGRDALFLAANGLRVTACDASPVAVARLRDRIGGHMDGKANPDVFVAWMSGLGPERHNALDAIYMRFVLHAVPRDEASHGIRWSWSSLKTGGALFIETRSVNSDLYGVGTSLAMMPSCRMATYRRFIRRRELTSELEGHGFQLEEVVEDRGLATLGSDDPVVIRVIARKPSQA